MCVRACVCSTTTSSDGRWATNDDDGGDRAVAVVVVYVVHASRHTSSVATRVIPRPSSSYTRRLGRRTRRLGRRPRHPQPRTRTSRVTTTTHASVRGRAIGKSADRQIGTSRGFAAKNEHRIITDAVGGWVDVHPTAWVLIFGTSRGAWVRNDS